ncbi:GGDEF domain-containing protein [Marinomonas spartinae]|uniref:GGDEF domain-containing protein n=1 Tax=Marinomonas spartinae TaxID=1792290 RepID=UPI0018F1266F|nr:GGDEF domain-containing protein [Marinomonas spartinae]MBJ7553794.1 GGDEF domain-containing protein [Marinomonas spartinae]
MTNHYDHLIHIRDHADVALYELIPDVVWIFDLDKHGWWWGNSAALKFWGLNTLEDLINKDLSGDTQGAKDRTAQTFELASKSGLTIDPWTTYPNGKPKTLYMRHRAVLVGPDKHRAIIAFINEEVNLGDTPENLLLVEAMRYTSVLVTSFSFAGDPIVENPAATEAYKHLSRENFPEGHSFFTSRLVSLEEGQRLLAQAIDEKGGQWTCDVNTSIGPRKHSLDIRITRHPLTGEFLLLMSEYDVSALHSALEAEKTAQDKLRQLAHYDAVTGVPSLHYLLEKEAELIIKAEQQNQLLSILYLDLDGFKQVNDNYGHEAGNQVLTSIAERLHSQVKEVGQIVRVGGDEFIIWLDRLDDRDEVLKLANIILNVVLEPVLISDTNKTVQVSTSLGIAHYPEHGKDMKSLIQTADSTMYRVKKQGKCDVQVAI